MKQYDSEKYSIRTDFNIESHTGFCYQVLERGDIIDHKRLRGKTNIFFFVMNGEVELHLDDTQIIKLRKDEFILIPSSSAFNLIVLESGEYIIHRFFLNNIRTSDNSLFCCYIENPDIKLTNHVPSSIGVCTRLKLFLELLQSYLINGLNCEYLQGVKESEFFFLLKKSYSNDEIFRIFHSLKGQDLYFKEAVLLHADFVKSRKELANRLNVSLSDLSRKFKAEFGISVHAWILKQRNSRIIHDLTVKNKSVKEIIIDFDFSSPANFNRYCKQHFGCTPTKLVSQIKR